jgi:hypothetical protein
MRDIPAPAGVSNTFVGKEAALARAIAATPTRDGGVRVWQYADAAFVGDRWVCVLEDDTTVYVVNVYPHRGPSAITVREAQERS